MNTIWSKFPHAVACFTPDTIKKIEQAWFEHNSSFGLMQQAAWQITEWLIQQLTQAYLSVAVVVGSGNNGGDGWLVAKYLAYRQPNWQIFVVEVAPPSTADAKKAKQLCQWDGHEQSQIQNNNLYYLTVDEFIAKTATSALPIHIDVMIDAIFGIGLDREPTDQVAAVIDTINRYRHRSPCCQVVSIDVPSGLNASTGEVYDQLAIHADITLCLLARKIGLHLKDSKDYVGRMIDLPLIPMLDTINNEVSAYYIHELPKLKKRVQNSHKGSFGHVLVIGGNRLANGQGMAGAAILAASSSFAVGVGKVTVACHADFHPAVISRHPMMMTADLHNIKAVQQLIGQVDVVVMGMGLGRDDESANLFNTYLNTVIKIYNDDNDSKQTAPALVIDADGLYHLANLWQSKAMADQQLCAKLKQISAYFTPHSGEAGRLLNQDYQLVDKDKIGAIQSLQANYGGHWLIKGAETIVSEGQFYICGFGNAGMATAGMGDVLSGVVAGMIATHIDAPLLTATLVHAAAGDDLASAVGEQALQADEMAAMIGKVMQAICTK